ncbi:MAG: hypothetical protein P1T08_12830 [Acidimicrobiia bacterium]|nr:hypothetical protein [Acidimicrobiia bacterium]
MFVPFRPFREEHDDAGGGAAGDGKTGDGDTGKSDEDNSKTFTQEDLDRVVADRLRRERSKYADYDDLKAKASEFDKAQEEQKTELEKATERAAAAEKAKADTDQRIKDALTRSMVITRAATKDIHDLDAAWRLLDTSTIEYGEDGQPTAKSVDEAIDVLVTEKPYLKKVAGTGSGDQGLRGGGSGTITRDDLKSMSPEDVEKAHNEGRLAHLLGVKQ